MNKLCVDKQKVVQELEDIGTKVAAMQEASVVSFSVPCSFNSFDGAVFCL